jgi:DNA-directed RNA polymerase subunit M/transcription elongation factor TFIIS
MRNELSTKKPAQGRVEHSPTCSRCGGVSAAFAILDTRNGKVYRLFRCTSCGNTTWTEEQ